MVAGTLSSAPPVLSTLQPSAQPPVLGHAMHVPICAWCRLQLYVQPHVGHVYQSVHGCTNTVVGTVGTACRHVLSTLKLYARPPVGPVYYLSVHGDAASIGIGIGDASSVGPGTRAW
jgi:hypothetical protein